MATFSVSRSRVSAFVLPLCMLALWDLLVRLSILPPSQSAAPIDVLRALGHLLHKGTLLTDTAYSLVRLVSGVGLGSAFAVAFSLAVTLSPKASASLSPTVQVLAGVPVVLWMPFCVMFFGTGELYKASLVCIATFFLVQVFIVQSLRSTERRYVELAEMYEKSVSIRVKHMFLPGSMPAILTSVRAAFAAGWVILFFVEFASSEQGRGGLGWFIADSRHAGRIEQEFAGLLWLAVVAFVLDLAIAKYQTWRLRWLDTSGSDQKEGTL